MSIKTHAVFKAVITEGLMFFSIFFLMLEDSEELVSLVLKKYLSEVSNPCGFTSVSFSSVNANQFNILKSVCSLHVI